MHNLDSNDMDELFREGAEQYEFSYNPYAWAMMEEKLDQHHKRRHLWYLLAALILMLASTLAWYSYSRGSSAHPAEITTINEVERSITKNQKQMPVESTNDSTVDLNQIKINPVAADNITGTTEKEEYINASSKVSSRNIGAQNSKSNVDMEVQSSDEGSPVSSLAVADTESYRASDRDESPVGESSASDRHADIDGVLSPVSGITDGSTADYFSIEAAPMIHVGVEYEASHIKYEGLPITSDPILPIAARSNRFAITAFANPEWSSVGISSTVRSGYKIGLKVGYQFAGKYQIDLGIARSEKKYGSDGLAFTNKNGWVDDIMPMWMDAKCNVIEIPLEVTYFFSGYENDGFFVNAGLSSYFLNSEWYAFEYDQALMRPGLLMEINPEDVETNYHMAGVSKLSVGYQKTLSPNLAFEVAPYLQIPLTGIGEGKVNLYSAGLQLGLRFNGK